MQFRIVAARSVAPGVGLSGDGAQFESSHQGATPGNPHATHPRSSDARQHHRHRSVVDRRVRRALHCHLFEAGVRRHGRPVHPRHDGKHQRRWHHGHHAGGWQQRRELHGHGQHRLGQRFAGAATDRHQCARFQRLLCRTIPVRNADGRPALQHHQHGGGRRRQRRWQAGYGVYPNRQRFRILSRCQDQ